MKNLVLSAISMFLCFCMGTACSSHDWEEESCIEAVIVGNTLDSQTTFSRSVSTILNEGTRISFYAQKGMEANGEILTLNQGHWKGNTPLSWINNGLEAEVCAYNPPLPLESRTLYQNNGLLTDILVAKKNYPNQSTINLKFKHLFSEINFKVEEQLNQQLQQICLTPQQCISKINPFTAAVTIIPTNNTDVNQTGTSSEVTKKSTVYSRHTNGIYSILIPPGTNQSVTIQIRLVDGKLLRKELKNQQFVGNQSYLCQIKQKSESVGINNAEEFIAFSHLINQLPYKGHTLKDFGVTNNGITTYYLNKDIHFTDDEKKRVKGIGIKGFSDIFDGQRHTLENIEISEKSTEDLGVFPHITEKGIVKDLRILRCMSRPQKTTGCMGIVCGRNEGQIINCHVKECETIAMQNRTGGIVGLNLGTIVNCSLNYFKLSTNQKMTQALSFGGISNCNHGKGTILNCLICNIELHNACNKSTQMACITFNSTGTVANCLSNHCSAKLHPFCKNCNPACTYCYFPAKVKYPLEEHSGIKPNEFNKYAIRTFQYTSASVTKTANLLNQWIETKGQTSYPLYVFRRWKSNGSNSISF